MPRHWIRAAAGRCHALPRPRLHRPARRAGRAAWRGTPDRIVVAGSASEFIHRITTWARLHGCTQVQLPPHSYGDYAQAAAGPWAGGVATQCQGCGGREGSDAAAPATLHWACEPASPLGTVDGVLSAWHGPTPPGSVRVLDCAYRPLRLATSHSDPELPASAWQLWSPNKNPGPDGRACRLRRGPLQGRKAWCPLQSLASIVARGAHGGPCWRPGPHRPCSNGWQTACPAQLERPASRPVHPTGLVRGARQPGQLFCRHPRHSARMTPARKQQTCWPRCPYGIKLRDCTSFLPGAEALGVLPPASGCSRMGL